MRVFVLHDRWGSPTGSSYTSGTEEEWALAEELYKVTKLRNIALFFKQVDAGKLNDPGDQLKPVLAFKKRIEEGKRYIFKQYETLDEFTDTLDGHLARWLKDHESAKIGLSAGGLLVDGTITEGLADKKAAASSPSFDYWIEESRRLSEADVPDHTGVLFCTAKAIDAAKADIEWARAKNTWGIAKFHLGKPDEAITAFAEIANKFLTSLDADRRFWCCNALFNKGITLAALGRSEDEIAVYDDVLARFGAAPELPLREQVAKALVNKGATLGALSRSEDAIAVYDDVLARFGAATELPLREIVAKALFNKGATLGALSRSEDAIAVYDDVLARFGAATELPLREIVAKAQLNKASI